MSGSQVQARTKKTWDEMYSRYCQYKEKNGDPENLPDPHKTIDPALHSWIKNQRSQYYKIRQLGPAGDDDSQHPAPLKIALLQHQLSPDRILKLEQVGFNWDTGYDVRWKSRFQELCQYKEKYGHCKVPTRRHENNGLGGWVATQRWNYALLRQGEKSTLTRDRIEMLESIGFVWGTNKNKSGTDCEPASEYLSRSQGWTDTATPPDRSTFGALDAAPSPSRIVEPATWTLHNQYGRSQVTPPNPSHRAGDLCVIRPAAGQQVDMNCSDGVFHQAAQLAQSHLGQTAAPRPVIAHHQDGRIGQAARFVSPARPSPMLHAILPASQQPATLHPVFFHNQYGGMSQVTSVVSPTQPGSVFPVFLPHGPQPFHSQSPMLVMAPGTRPIAVQRGLNFATPPFSSTSGATFSPVAISPGQFQHSHLARFH